MICIRPALLLLPLLVLVGCVNLNTYCKEGVTFRTLNNDLTNCEVSAVQKVPVKKLIRRTPMYFTPTRTVCEGDVCRTYGGELRGGEIYTVDANEDLRKRVKAQCMSNKGYDFVEIPRCTSDQLEGRLVAPVERLPRLSGSLCATRLSNGTRGIIDLSAL